MSKSQGKDEEMRGLSSPDQIRRLLLPILALQVVFTVSVVLDVPILRQIVGFVYLTFVPGVIFIRILGLRKLDITETLFFSVVVGIAFLMILGIIVNLLGPLLGITGPLSLWPLFLSISLTVITSLFLINHFFRSSDQTPHASNIPTYVIFLPIVVGISVVGTILVNTQTTNLVSMIMIIAVSVLVIWGGFSKESPTFRALTLLCAFLSLMLGSLLVTNYITGWDEWRELFTFSVTKDNSYWNLFQPISWNLDYLKTNAMASVTILPTIYSTIMNLDNTWVFKIVYPLLSSFMALGLYHLYRTQLDEITSFFGTFFYLVVTIGLFGPMRQLIGQLFFISLLLILFDKRIRRSIRNILFVILGFGLVISHYSLAYVFLVMVVIVWFIGNYISRSTRRIITGEYVGVFTVMTFMWYMYTEASGPLYGLLDPGRSVLASFIQDFMNPSARGSTVLQGIGVLGGTSLLHTIGSLFFLSTELLIIIGFVWTILKRRTTNIDRNYVYIMMVSIVLLVLNIIVPNLSNTFRMERFYQVSLIALAPAFVLGIKTVTNYVRKFHSRFDIKNLQVSIILVILISLFLFRSEFVYEVTNDHSSSLHLSLNRMDYHDFYGRTTNVQEVVGAKFLSEYSKVTNRLVFADKLLIDSVLYGYGQILLDHAVLITNYTLVDLFSGAPRFESYDKYIYLGTINLEHNAIIGWLDSPLNWDESANASSTRLNRAYSNGGCEILLVTD